MKRAKEVVVAENSTGGLNVSIPPERNNQDIPPAVSVTLANCRIVSVTIVYSDMHGRLHKVTQQSEG